ncbi:MAG: DUF4974 domain-containing protein [Muribaculaceae bacterium]|nr:DUF4974 domain-containing protein [Muribaculaceae bacterium]
MERDKYTLVLDIIENSDDYTSEQLAEILSDPETREIYNLLCMTRSAVDADKDIDVETEWERFTQEHADSHRRRFALPGRRAASIAAIIGTSIVAVAAGIAVTVAVIVGEPEPSACEEIATPPAVAETTGTITTKNDSINDTSAPVMFENEPLERIMKEIALAYNIQVKFNNKEAASLHLYYRLDPSLTLNEVVEQLNTFEQINFTQNGNTLNID